MPYVHETICENNELEVNAFSMTERILVRGGKPCGLYFCLHGPRAVKFTAIWETDRNSVLFYGATGERVHPHATDPGTEPVGLAGLDIWQSWAAVVMQSCKPLLTVSLG